MAGVQKVFLNNININIKNALIIGIIIAKNTPRSVGSKKKSGESRAVMSFTIRDSEIDTINVDIWGSQYFVHTFYERFLVGDVVEISSPKICIKTGDNEAFRPQVTSPFFLSLNEGLSDVSVYGGDFSQYLPLLHIPTKIHAVCTGLSEIYTFKEDKNNTYIDLLVVVKSVKAIKNIKTKAGVEMSVRSIEIMDNTTPGTLTLDVFDMDTIQRAEQFRPIDVLFVSDVRVSWRGGTRLQMCGKSVLTHQPHTPEAEALRLYISNQANTRGGAATWSGWGERTVPATVRQTRDRLATGGMFCAELHALLTHLDLDELLPSTDNTLEEFRIRLADHTGELTAVLPINVMENVTGYTVAQIKNMNDEQKTGLRWMFMLEHCYCNISVTPPRVVVLSLRKAIANDPIPLY